MSPGWFTIPSKDMLAGERTSRVASTMLMTAPPADKELETNARNLSPLKRRALLEGLEPPQETMATLPATRTAKVIKVFFKPGTPSSMRDRDLDARNGIIAEGVKETGEADFTPSYFVSQGKFSPDAKPRSILYSQLNGNQSLGEDATVARLV